MSAGYLIDTNVVSELRKDAGRRRCAGAWFEAHAGESLWLSALVVGELRRGVELTRRRRQGGGRSIDGCVASPPDFADQILPVTTEVCEQWAVLNVPDPLPVVDGLLAATAVGARPRAGHPQHSRRRAHRRATGEPVRPADPEDTRAALTDADLGSSPR